MIERSLVLVKPSGVRRKLVGEIISRFEKIGFNVAGMKMVRSSEEIINDHYKLSEEWARNLFDKSKASAEKEGKEFPFSDHMEFSRIIQSRLKDVLREGPIVAMVLEGPHAIEIVRKMVGATNVKNSAPGTIRGDFLFDSYELADKEKRAIDTLVHASDSVKEAEREINLWFNEKELFK